jgi:hypothetical protein
MPLPFVKKLGEQEEKGLVFESVKDVEQTLLEIFASVINQANSGAYFPLDESETGNIFRSIFRFNTRENIKTDYNQDYFVLIPQEVDSSNEFSIFIKDKDGKEKRVEAYNACLTFDLEFLGTKCFDAFMLLRNNFGVIDEEFKKVLSGEEMRFDLSGAKQHTTYQKTDDAKISVLSYTPLKFYFFLLKKQVNTLKDINFFIIYGR